MLKRYYREIVEILDRIEKTQKQPIEDAAQKIAKTIADDGIIYIFGCGHSHLIALDCFYRAGGLANVSAVLDTDLMLHNGAAKSSAMEKMSGIAGNVVRRYCMTEKDVFIVVSTSGKNAVPIEAVKAAKSICIPTISVTSMAYTANEVDHVSKHADIVIDNGVPCGDAVVTLAGMQTPMGSVSTVASSFIMQSVILRAAEIAHCVGAEVPVYKSGNIPGGAKHNQAIIDKYLPRIKHL